MSINAEIVEIKQKMTEQENRLLKHERMTNKLAKLINHVNQGQMTMAEILNEGVGDLSEDMRDQVKVEVEGKFIEINQKIDTKNSETEQEINNLKEAVTKTTIDRHQSNKLKNLRDRRIGQIVGGMFRDNCKYVLFFGDYAKYCFGDLKRKFDISSYLDISLNEFEDAIKFVEKWLPSKKQTNNIISSWLTKRDNNEIKPSELKALNTYFTLQTETLEVN